MALPIKEQRYSSIQLADADLEDDSDTTLGSIGFSANRTKRRRRVCQKPGTQALFIWFRWLSVIVLQSIIIFLLVRKNQTPNHRTSGWSQTDTETGGDINGLYIPSKNISEANQYDRTNLEPQLRINTLCWLRMRNHSYPTWQATTTEWKYERIGINLCLVSIPLLLTRFSADWPLVGSGSVSIPDYAQHPMLGKPISDDPIRSGPIYEASWTHALHCVSSQRAFVSCRSLIWNKTAVLLCG